MMPAKISSGIRLMYSDTQKDILKKGILVFEEIIKENQLKFITDLILYNAEVFGDAGASVDEVITSFNKIFPVEFSLFLLNSILAYNVEFEDFIKQLKMEHSQRFIEHVRLLSALFGKKLREMIQQTKGPEWRRINSVNVISESQILQRHHIVLQDGVQFNFTLTPRSTLNFMTKLLRTIYTSLELITEDVLLQLNEIEIITVQKLTNDLIARIKDEINKPSNPPIIKEIDLENLEINTLVGTEDLISFQIMFGNYNNVVKFDSSINSTFILFRHLLGRFTDGINKVNLALLHLSDENFHPFKEKVDELLERHKKVQSKYPDLKNVREE